LDFGNSIQNAKGNLKNEPFDERNNVSLLFKLRKRRVFLVSCGYGFPYLLLNRIFPAVMGEKAA